MKHKIFPVVKKNDIPKVYRNHPIELLLEYHNLDHEFDSHPRPVPRKDAMLLGLRDYFKDTFNGNHCPEYFSDRTHPDSEGYYLLAKRIAEKVREMFSRNAARQIKTSKNLDRSFIKSLASKFCKQRIR